jgi:GTPase SAR1 family protein
MNNSFTDARDRKSTKSTYFRRYMNNSFTDATDRKSTMGLDHYGKIFNVGDKNLKLQLWDTGGKH